MHPNNSLLCLLQRPRHRIDAGKLPGPARVVQEGAVVKAVVVGRVGLGVVGGRQRGGLVPVEGVAGEEVLHALRNLAGRVPAGAITPYFGQRACASTLPSIADPAHTWRATPPAGGGTWRRGRSAPPCAGGRRCPAPRTSCPCPPRPAARSRAPGQACLGHASADTPSIRPARRRPRAQAPARPWAARRRPW